MAIGAFPAAVLVIVVTLSDAAGGPAPSEPRGHCPSTRPFVNCTMADPCDYARPCRAHPQAVCRPDFCGGCVAKFFVDWREVHCENEIGVVCELSYTGFGCYDDKTIRVRWANYGRRNSMTCRHAYDADTMHNATACLQPNATGIVRHLCDGMSECFPDVSNAAFGDPCYSIYKYLEVDYECVDTRANVGYLASAGARPSAGSRHLVWILGAHLLTSLLRPTVR